MNCISPIVDTEAINVVPPAVPGSPPPLAPVYPKAEIARELQIQVKIGNAIREHRLRDYHELDIARQEKLEWVQRCTELLMRSFNGIGAAEQFNNWVATILPEYAEFGLFVEHFNEEMKHRLNQLKAIAKSLRNMPEPFQPPTSTSTKGTDMVTVTEQANVATTNPTSPEVAAPVVAQAMQAAQAQAALRSVAAASVASQTSRVAGTVVASSRASTSSNDTSGLLIVRANEDDSACESVRLFVEQLGLLLHVSKRAASCNSQQSNSDNHASSNNSGTPLLDELAAMQSSPASFALLFTASGDQPQQSADPDALFDLGCCVGKLGAGRVIVLHRGGEAHTDRFGLTHIVFDDFDGWRLQLARHLKRAGVDVDLNKLI